MSTSSGAVAVIMQRALVVRLPGQPGRLRLTPGQTIYSRTVNNLAEEMECHLRGTVETSDLRFGILLMLSYRTKSSASRSERSIDEWLDPNTAFVVGELPERMLGLDRTAVFNDLAVAWRLRQVNGSNIQ